MPFFPLPDTELDHRKARIELGLYLIYTSALLGFYNLTIELLDKIFKFTGATTYGTILTLIFYSCAFLIMIKHMKLPLSKFGFRLGNHVKKDIIEALVWTVLFCIFLTGLKFLLIRTVTVLSILPLFDFSLNSFAGFRVYQETTPVWFFSGFLYLLFTPAQTFIMQGAIQSPLIFLLESKHATWISILLSTLMFGALHIDLHLVYAYSVLLPGFMWAVMYARQRSLLGVTLSHAIVGLWAFWALGFEYVFDIISRVWGLPHA